MSHFTTLVHTYVNTEQLQENHEFRIQHELRIAAIKAALKEKPNDFMLKFYLKEAQHPSTEFENAVTTNIEDIMAPFCECTEDPEYREFEDKTDELTKDYETGTTECVKFSNGIIVSQYDRLFRNKFMIKDGVVFEKNWGQLKHDKRSKNAKSIKVIPDYPLKKLYPDFDSYAKDHCNYTYDEEECAYGYYYNPNSFWDWYAIGGRWPHIFLVKDTCTFIIQSDFEHDDNIQTVAPDGYRWVCGARKCDIEWDLMKKIKADYALKNFASYEEWFNSGKLPDGFFGGITDEGIYSWQDLIYAKGETADEHLRRIGLAPEQQYVPGIYSYVQDGEWISKGDMGWFGITVNDKPEDNWRSTLAAHINSLDDDAVLVGVDCHI